MTLNVTAARFDPMRRLLSGEDEAFLIRQGFRREAGQLRTDHRRLFFRFVKMLAKDFDRVHAARKSAMVDNWNFDTLLRERWTASSCLFAMRTAGFMHWMHLPQAAELAARYVSQLDRRVSIQAPSPAHERYL